LLSNTKGYVRLSILNFEVLSVKFWIVHFALRRLIHARGTSPVSFQRRKLPIKLTTLGHNPEEREMNYKTVYTTWIKQQ